MGAESGPHAGHPGSEMGAVFRQAALSVPSTTGKGVGLWDQLRSAPDPRLPTCSLPSAPSSRKQLEGSCEARHPLFPSPADLQVFGVWGMKQQVLCPEITSQAPDGVAPPGTLRLVHVETPCPQAQHRGRHTPRARLALGSSPQTGPMGAPDAPCFYFSVFLFAKGSCPHPTPLPVLAKHALRLVPC